VSVVSYHSTNISMPYAVFAATSTSNPAMISSALKIVSWRNPKNSLPHMPWLKRTVKDLLCRTNEKPNNLRAYLGHIIRPMSSVTEKREDLRPEDHAIIRIQKEKNTVIIG